MKWINAVHPGVRYREHSTRIYKGNPDRYFSIYYHYLGKRREEGLGWASNGWSIEKAAAQRAKLKRNQSVGKGPCTMAEKRDLNADMSTLKHIPVRHNLHLNLLLPVDHASLEERLQFEELISGLSAEFINLPVDRIDQMIEEGQKKVCETLRLHRSVFLELSLDDHLFTATHSWSAPGVSRQHPHIVKNEYALVTDAILEGKTVFFSDPDEVPPEAVLLKQRIREYGITSILIVPLRIGENIIGEMTWESHGSRRDWPKPLVNRLELISMVFANALSRKRSEEALGKSIAEIKKLQDQLEAENRYLLNEIKLEHRHHQIVGDSPVIRKVLGQVEAVADTHSTVLILGETGTGKELVATAIHDLSPRRDRHMVKVNCAALPPTLIESELFGHEKGAYTGALSRKLGRFEMANGSTLFLDEVGELSVDLQVKLLRVLQEGQFERVGGSQTITVDVRVVAATNADLAGLVREGRFRKDLFFRLNVFPITIPPLRSRAEDIPQLVRTFVEHFSSVMRKNVDTISAGSMEALKRYGWPGNVRELKNLVERSMIVCRDGVIDVRPPSAISMDDAVIDTMDSIQRKHILYVLEKTGGRVNGDSGAARLLGMNPSTLRARMKHLGIGSVHVFK